MALTDINFSDSFRQGLVVEISTSSLNPLGDIVFDCHRPGTEAVLNVPTGTSHAIVDIVSASRTAEDVLVNELVLKAIENSGGYVS